MTKFTINKDSDHSDASNTDLSYKLHMNILINMFKIETA